MMADDVAALLDTQGIARAHVAGLSMGGCIAQELALRHPQKVGRLVLIRSWARCDIYMKTVFAHFRKMREACDDANASETPQPRQGFEGQCDACSTYDAIDRLSAIAAPTLVTVGAPAIFTPLACSELLHARIPGSRLEVFERSGHLHHWEEVETFNTITTQFLLED